MWRKRWDKRAEIDLNRPEIERGKLRANAALKQSLNKFKTASKHRFFLPENSNLEKIKKRGGCIADGDSISNKIHVSIRFYYYNFERIYFIYASKHTHPLLRGASQNMLSALLVRQNDTVPYALYWTIRFGVSSKDRRQFLRQYVQILDNKINLFHCSDFML